MYRTMKNFGFPPVQDRRSLIKAKTGGLGSAFETSEQYAATWTEILSGRSDTTNLIERFNRYFWHSGSPNREMLYYITQTYNELKQPKYWNQLSANQQSGLTEKMLAYQRALREVEGGGADPRGTAIQPETGWTYPDLTKSEMTTFPIEGETFNILGFEIPKSWAYYGGAGLGAAALLSSIMKKKR